MADTCPDCGRERRLDGCERDRYPDASRAARAESEAECLRLTVARLREQLASAQKEALAWRASSKDRGDERDRLHARLAAARAALAEKDNALREAREHLESAAIGGFYPEPEDRSDIEALLARIDHALSGGKGESK